MLKSDEAALALLERICLFRLGVDCQTLAAIFTGTDAEKVSGEALAGLDAAQLQQKLAWLVRMRIVEQSEPDSLPKTLYTIHPAVRDGFLSGIGRETAQASHEAVRLGLAVSLGDAPGENPSDPGTLELLEEIVHHTLQSGHVREAWDIYWNRIGGFKNLGWRLGAYERGERICRAFAGGQSVETMAVCLDQPEGASPRLPTDGDVQEPDASAIRLMPFLGLDESTQGAFINGWAMYLLDLGRLTAAARCYEVAIEMAMRQENWKNASIGNQNLCDVWLVTGHLSRLQKEEAAATSARLGASSDGALATADEALRLTELADDDVTRKQALAYHGYAYGICGKISTALGGFRTAEALEKKQYGHERPLWGNRGFFHTSLLARIGRHQETARLTQSNIEVQLMELGDFAFQVPQCQLILSSLSIAHSGSPSSAAASSNDLWTQARDWALARDAKEVLCWSYLVEAQHALASHDRVPLAPPVPNPKGQAAIEASGTQNHLSAARTALESGLKIARDCGFGLYHIDLLLEQARLHLLRGDAGAALADVELALDTGVPANEETGQPELLAANHEACGYAWAIPAGLQLRAEAQLLQAAQLIGEPNYKPRSRKTPPEARDLIKQAKSNLQKAMRRWKKLRDPEPTEDNNFKHPETEEEYNHRAAETCRILQDLDGGLLTSCPLECTAQSETEPTPEQSSVIPTLETARTDMTLPNSARSVFISYAHADNENKNPKKRWLDRLITHLKPLVRQEEFTVCSDEDILIGDDWHAHLQAHLSGAKAAVLLVSPDFLASDYIAKSEVPVLLKNAADAGVKMFPIIISPCLYARTEFKYPDPKTGPNVFTLESIQAANPPSKTLVEMDEGEQNRVMTKVAEQLADLLNP
jgi:hypothetical protein